MTSAATNQATTFAFILSFLGGVIVTVVSAVNVVWFSQGAPAFGGYGTTMRGVMDGYHNFMGSYASSSGFFAALSLVAVICGVVVLMSAILLRVQPHQRTAWAVVIVAASIVSFVGMGGYFVGAVLGLVGGSFELYMKQTRP